MAVFDYEPLGAKTGIANRALRPLLGLVDPLHVLSMPERVTAFSGYVFYIFQKSIIFNSSGFFTPYDTNANYRFIVIMIN